MMPDEELIIKVMLFRDHEDRDYHYGMWVAPGKGWPMEKWQAVIDLANTLDRLFSDFAVPLRDFESPWLDALGDMVESGYDEIIRQIAPELKQVPFEEVYV